MCIIPDEFKRTKPAANNTLKRWLKMRIKRYLDEDMSMNLYDNSSYNKQGFTIVINYFSENIITDFNYKTLKAAMIDFNEQLDLIGFNNG
jgi:hypothetical protein